MVTELEVDAVNRALINIDARIQDFVGEQLTSTVLAQIAAIAQTSLFDAGQREGYDWRCIHFKTEKVGSDALDLKPIGLDAYGNELLNRVFDRYAKRAV